MLCPNRKEGGNISDLELLGGAPDLIGDDPENVQFTELWLYEMKSLSLTSPLDEGARDAAIAYFDSRPRSISGCAARLGVERKTALRRLERADRKGWVTVYAAPEKAGGATPSRVVGRNVFWPQGLPEWSGDTSAPVF